MPKVGGGKPAGGGPKVGGGKPAGGGKGGPSIGQGQPVPGGPPPAAAPPGGGPTSTPTPTISPFMTAEDIMAYAEARKNYESQLAELDYNYATAVANTGYEKEQITKGAIQGKSDTNWDTAGRGLWRSSVRDADLFDIDATAEMRKRFLDTQLDTLKLNTEAQKAALNTMWNDPETGYMHGLQLKEVQNAQAASAGLPASTETGGTPPPPSISNPGGQPAKGLGGPPKPPKPKPKPGGPAIGPGKPVSSSPKIGGNQKVKGKLA